MISGVGIDIVSNHRFCNMEEGLKGRLFTDYEIEEAERSPYKCEYYASRFAAKEAFSKALGTGFRKISPKDIEIKADNMVKPYRVLLKKLNIDYKIHLSISHEKEMSVAMVVLEDGTL